MKDIYYQIINFLILAIGLGWVLQKALRQHYKKQREDLQKQMSEASAQHEKMQAEYQEVKTLLATAHLKIDELKASSKKEIEFETQRLSAEAESLSLKIMKDAEVKVRAETDRAKLQLERELMEAAVAAAREALREEFKTKDAEWTSSMVQSESDSRATAAGARK